MRNGNVHCTPKANNINGSCRKIEYYGEKNIRSRWRWNAFTPKKLGRADSILVGFPGFSPLFHLSVHFSALILFFSSPIAHICRYQTLWKTKKFNLHCDQPHLLTIQYDLSPPLVTFFLFQLTDRYYYVPMLLKVFLLKLYG